MAGKHLAFDIVVIGAGTAGCVLANRLSVDPELKVALIEAGGPATDPRIHDPAAWPLLPGTAVDWGFRTTPQPGTAGRAHDWPRGRVIGGSSTINAMAHVRGHPSDFDGWNLPGWGFADLLPWFRQSETSPFGPSPRHGADGPVRLLRPTRPHPVTEAFVAAGQECGLAPITDHNGPHLIGPTLNTLAIVEGRRQTVADAYLTPEVLARPNLTLLTGRLVDRIECDAAGRARTVQMIADDRPEAVSAEVAIILAAGAISSPAILLRSGIGPAAELEALGIEVALDLPGVGRNLHDHLFGAGNLYEAPRPMPPSRYQHSESLLYLGTDGTDGPPRWVVACVVAPAVSERFDPVAPGRHWTLLFGQTRPLSRGRLWLRSADPRQPPLIDPAYLSRPEDRAAMREALDWARRLGGSAALADWRGAEVLPAKADLASTDAVDRFVARAAITHHHPVGTCRMGLDAAAVVSSDLAVRGIEGLFVVDGSVLPRLTSGPVNAAILAIAEKAAAMLRGSLASSDPAG